LNTGSEDPIGGSFFPGVGFATVQDKGNNYNVYNGVRVGSNWAPWEGTSFGLSYQYDFRSFSNSPSSEYAWRQAVTPTFSQALPWEGGSVSITQNFRVRKKNSVASKLSPDTKVHDFRYLMEVGLDQAINKYMTGNLYFMYYLLGNNNDNYDDLDDMVVISLGMTFSY
jgi:hypothetical protein